MANSAPRRPSRAETPSGSPYRWLDVELQGISGLDRVAENEFFEALEGVCSTQGRFDQLVEEVDARKGRAAAGLLAPPDEQPPTRTRTANGLWEVRWRFAEGEFRLYYAEPAGFPELLLALKDHWKWCPPHASSVEITARQDAEIAAAGRRFRRSAYFIDGLDIDPIA